MCNSRVFGSMLLLEAKNVWAHNRTGLNNSTGWTGHKIGPIQTVANDSSNPVFQRRPALFFCCVGELNLGLSAF